MGEQMKKIKKESVGLYVVDEFGKVYGAITKISLTQIKKINLTPGAINRKPLYKITDIVDYPAIENTKERLK